MEKYYCPYCGNELSMPEKINSKNDYSCSCKNCLASIVITKINGVKKFETARKPNHVKLLEIRMLSKKNESE